MDDSSLSYESEVKDLNIDSKVRESFNLSVSSYSRDEKMDDRYVRSSLLDLEEEEKAP